MNKKEKTSGLFLTLAAAVLFTVLSVLLDNGRILTLPADERGVFEVQDPARLAGKYVDDFTFDLEGEIRVKPSADAEWAVFPAGTRGVDLRAFVYYSEKQYGMTEQPQETRFLTDKNPAYVGTQHLMIGDRVDRIEIEAVPPDGTSDTASGKIAEEKAEYPQYDLSGLSFQNYRIVNEVRINPYLCAFTFLTVFGGGMLVFYRKVFSERPEWAFLLISLTAGTLLAVSLPRNKVGYDEETHLQAVMDIASMPAGMHVSDAVVNGMVVTEFNNPSYQPGNEAEMEQFDSYLAANGDYKTGENAPDFYTLPNRIPAYLAMALSVKLAKGLSLSWPLILVCGRLANLVLYAALMFFAIRRTPVGKWLMLTIALFPQNVFLAATYSYDPFVTGCLMLFAACFLRALWDRDFVRPGNLILMLAAGFLGCLPKAVYAPVILVALLLPKRFFCSTPSGDCREHAFPEKRCGAAISRLYRAAVIVVFFILIASFILPTVVSPAETGDLRGGETSEISQVGFILQKPFLYAWILLRQMISWIPQCFFAADSTTFMGHLVNGYTETKGYWQLYILLLIFAVLFDRRQAAAGENGGNGTWRTKEELRGFSAGERLFIFLMTGAACVLIWTSMYVAFTEPGAREIAGVQGRYFIPLLYLLYLLLSVRKPVKEEGRHSLTAGFRNLASRDELWYYNLIPALLWAGLVLTIWNCVTVRFCL
ncbi:MAG: DUF2142 domain-containing protein [Eubacteriales bacterium]|nr:DUF2142 domain-containing protein [Eubacteriales bacterium]